MSTQEIIGYFNKHSWAIRCGASKIAKDTHSSILDVLEAKLLYNRLKGKKSRRNKSYMRLHSNAPKILVFDIETSPMLAYVWKRWKENIHLELTISEWFVICWSAKWLLSDKVMGDVLTPEEVLKEDDKRVVTSLWHLFNEADIVVAHNGDKFDIPKMNSRFIINGLPPTSPYLSVDTCKVVKRQFGFSSNKLDALATYFGFDHKLETSFELWRDCLKGDLQSLDYMLEYNKRDVTLLEEVYLKLKPWIKSGPNMTAFIDTNIPICCKCGTSNVVEIEGKYYHTSVGKYKLYRCSKCGAVSRGRKNCNHKVLATTTLAH